MSSNFKGWHQNLIFLPPIIFTNMNKWYRMLRYLTWSWILLITLRIRGTIILSWDLLWLLVNIKRRYTPSSIRWPLLLLLHKLLLTMMQKVKFILIFHLLIRTVIWVKNTIRTANHKRGIPMFILVKRLWGGVEAFKNDISKTSLYKVQVYVLRYCWLRTGFYNTNIMNSSWSNFSDSSVNQRSDKFWSHLRGLQRVIGLNLR